MKTIENIWFDFEKLLDQYGDYRELRDQQRAEEIKAQLQDVLLEAIRINRK